MTPTETLDLAAVKRGQQADVGERRLRRRRRDDPPRRRAAGRQRRPARPARPCSTSPAAPATRRSPPRAAATRVTCTDYVPGAARARPRAGERRAARRSLFEPADAEALPYADASYDVVLSVFGAMFAPDQEHHRRRATAGDPARRADRARRAGRPRASSASGSARSGAHVAPPAGLASPLRWGSEERRRRAARRRRELAPRAQARVHVALPGRRGDGADVPRAVRADRAGRSRRSARTARPRSERDLLAVVEQLRRAARERDRDPGQVSRGGGRQALSRARGPTRLSMERAWSASLLRLAR